MIFESARPHEAFCPHPTIFEILPSHSWLEQNPATLNRPFDISISFGFRMVPYDLHLRQNPDSSISTQDTG